MIASTGWFYPSGSSTATCANAPSSTYYGLAYSYSYYEPPPIEQPDPKRRIPFYRALFSQAWPARVAALAKDLPRLKWWPLMAPRVRVDRT
jgi:hypothetical protein